MILLSLLFSVVVFLLLLSLLLLFYCPCDILGNGYVFFLILYIFWLFRIVLDYDLVM